MNHRIRHALRRTLARFRAPFALVTERRRATGAMPVSSAVPAVAPAPAREVRTATGARILVRAGGPPYRLGRLRPHPWPEPQPYHRPVELPVRDGGGRRADASVGPRPSAQERRRAALALAMDGVIASPGTVQAYDLGAALLAQGADGPACDTVPVAGVAA
ncbi:hypothetical protein [Streptomyces xinghaiensis]|uniref:hypothetical protein n=1 Tax=Streptomyces xinghaiensis TaxID=1038928 RepID=UPI003C2CE1B5